MWKEDCLSIHKAAVENVLSMNFKVYISDEMECLVQSSRRRLSIYPDNLSKTASIPPEKYVCHSPKNEWRYNNNNISSSFVELLLRCNTKKVMYGLCCIAHLSAIFESMFLLLSVFFVQTYAHFEVLVKLTPI